MSNFYFFETNGRRDFSRVHNLYIFALARLQTHNAAKPLFLIIRRIVYGVPRTNRAGVHAEKRQRPNEGIYLQFKYKSRKRRLVTRFPYLFSSRICVNAFSWRYIERRW